MKRIKYTDEQKKVIFELYKNCHTTEEVLEEIRSRLGIDMTIHALYSLASSNGIKREKSFPKQKNDINTVLRLIKDYESGEYTVEQIAEKYGYKTRKSVTDKVKQYGGRMKTAREWIEIRRDYDVNMFEKIDSEWKAYFLGLLLTDGYCSAERGTIGLDLTDEHTIRYLSKMTGKRYQEIDETGKYVFNKYRRSNRYRIVFTSKKMVDDLKRFGVIDRKTYDLTPPLLDEEEEGFLTYILRGIIDGDGWVRKDGHEFFIASASYEFIDWCKDRLEDIGMKDLRITKTIHENTNYVDTYFVRSATIHNIEILSSKIYLDDNIGMKVKKDKVLSRGRSETITGEA